jgi:tRNA (guanine37-N1)-methyltransferase
MGSIHLYLFKKKHEIDALARAWNKAGLTVTGLKRCGNIAPGVSRWVFDIVKEIP